jgi:hypothetical protein
LAFFGCGLARSEVFAFAGLIADFGGSLEDLAIRVKNWRVAQSLARGNQLSSLLVAVVTTPSDSEGQGGNAGCLAAFA